jgi:predicted nucleic acid-binding Zn ribbon protein
MGKKEEKVCLECGTKIIGRADKKFCSDQCRVSFNNKVNRDETAYMNNVTNILRKNRRILLELNPSGKARVNRDKMNEKGFDFTYFTSQYKTKEGAIYNFCYEHGYLALENNWYLLVVKSESPKQQPL